MTELRITLPVEVVENHYGNLSVSIKHVVKFTINEFSWEKCQVYSSPTFPLPFGRDRFEGCIVLYFLESCRQMTAYIKFLPQYEAKVSGKLKWFVQTITGLICTRDTVMNEKTLGSNGWGGYMTDFRYIDQGGNLEISCEIFFSLCGNISPLDIQVPQSQLSKDLANLMLNEELSDITFKVGNKELKAHKAILSARSPVFNRMFKSDMTETKLNTVEIKDIKFEVLQSVLRYIYTDEVANVDTQVDELLSLLSAAEKYQLEDLKPKCEEVLAKTLTVKNAAQTLLLADLHRADQLRIQTIHFINCHRQEVLETEGMRLAMEEHPKVLLKAFFY